MDDDDVEYWNPWRPLICVYTSEEGEEIDKDGALVVIYDIQLDV